MDKTKILQNIYYNKDGAPGAFQGAQRLFKAARKVNSKILYSDVMKFLEREATYQRNFDDTQRKKHHPLKSKSKRMWHVAQLGWIGLDCMYMAQGLGSPFPYLMIGVDLFSSKVYHTFLKKLDAKTGVAAVKRIISQIIGYELIGCCSDLGPEFALVRAHLREMEKRYYVAPAQSPNKISQAERTVKTIRVLAGRILGSDKVSSAMQAVKLAIESHNNTPSARLGWLSPNQVLPDQQGHVLNYKLKRKLELESKITDVKPLLVGQIVRIKLQTTRFAKSNMPKYSAELYKIDSIVPHSPSFGYRLRKLDTYALLPGSFNQTQLLIAE